MLIIRWIRMNNRQVAIPADLFFVLKIAKK